MCNEAVANYFHALEIVLEGYKTQKICVKAVGTYPSTIKFVPECLMSQEFCNKTVNIYFFVFDSFRDWYKTQEM